MIFEFYIKLSRYDNMSKRLFSPLKKKEEWSLERFSVKLLEKEIELEKHFRLEVIEDLITLYSQAIEHYNETQDTKYLDYQDRLHTLLMKPEVSSVLNGRRNNNMYINSRRKTLADKEILKSRLLESTKKAPQLKLDIHKNRLNRDDIVNNISCQDNQLEARISNRRSRKLVNIQELNDVSTKPSYFLDEKEQMEEIMERYFSEKAKSIEEITLRYLLAMDPASPATRSLLAQNMQKEIIETSESFDRQRIQEVQDLKAPLRSP